MIPALLLIVCMGFAPVSAMDNMAEDFIKKLTYDGILPYEIDAKIDAYMSPISVSESKLSATEHAEYNLPFRYNPIDLSKNDDQEVSAQKNSAPITRGCTLQHCDSSESMGNDFLIINKESWQNPINEFFRCIGPFSFNNEPACLLSRNSASYESLTLKLERHYWKRENECYYMHVLFDVHLKANTYGYPVDSDSGNLIFYTARHNGSIVKHRYVPTKRRLCLHEEFQPPLSEKTLKMLYKTQEVFDGVTVHNANQFAIQFDHTQPEILLIRSHPWTTDYTVFHRPTGYMQHVVGDSEESAMKHCGKRIGFRTGKLIYYPLLKSTSEARLRLMGDDVGINLVTVMPHISGLRGLRVMSLVQHVKDLCAHYKQHTLVNAHGAAQDLLTLFKFLVPIVADRYFFVWQSQQEDKTYALKELYSIVTNSEKT